MTLAEILSLSVLAWALGVPVCAAQSPPPAGSTQQVPSSQPSDPNAPQNQSSTAQNTSKASGGTTRAKPVRRATKKGRKKTAASVNCTPTGASGKHAGAKASQNTTSTHTGNSSTNTGHDPSKMQTPANCPPTITVIRNGGSTEPSIELLGGAAGQQASNEKTTTDQLLAATKENLDKLSGKNLSSSQQAMITQIQQFMSESRESVAAGEMDRGRTLAIKAKLLSDELAKP